MKWNQVMRARVDENSLFFTLLLYVCFSSVASTASPTPPSSSSSSSCHLHGHFGLMGMHRAGDVLLGGLFPVRPLFTFHEASFSSEPALPHCHGLDVSGFRQAQTMAFAIEEINSNANLLPNVTLGYHVYDSCYQTAMGFRAVLALLGGAEKQVTVDGSSCVGAPPVLGIVGDPSPAPSLAISSVLGLYRVPLISHFSTCSSLSEQFLSFFRTMPSLSFQVRAFIHIIQRFGWSWVGLLVSVDEYGVQAARAFASDLGPLAGSCVAYTEALPWDADGAELRRIVDVMKKSTARVVVAFTSVKQMTELMEEVVRQNVTGLQWMASEAWASAAALQTPRLMPFLGGTLGIASRPGELPGFRDFLLQIRPDTQHNSSLGSNMVNGFWEHTFECRFAPPPAGWLEAGGALCSGRETLADVPKEQLLDASDLLDVSALRSEYNVYKAVYSLAHALDELLRCKRGGASSRKCAPLQRLEPWQIVSYLEKMNFTTAAGDPVSFDESGDALLPYDIVNWVWLPNGSTTVQNVGEVRRSVVKDEELFILDEDQIFWNFESKQPPLSVCGLSCPPGTHMVRRTTGPKCCFNCAACPAGTFSNKSNSPECVSCRPGFKPNPQRDGCVVSRTFLSFHEPVAIVLVFITVVGALCCMVVFGIFIHYRTTPIVRSNNSELSFILLVSLKLDFLTALLFIGKPVSWQCKLRHIGHAMSYVLCLSCLLVKTIVVLAVFKSTKPGADASMKWFGVPQQRGTIVILFSVEIVVCTMWLVSLHSPYKNEWTRLDSVVHQCLIESMVGQSINMYTTLVTIVSFVLAFLVRNIPSNFNEAKLIAFSMCVQVSVGVGAAMTTATRQGKITDIMKILSIVGTSYGILLILFIPKCYIILFRPEKNTKKALMGRGS